MEKNGKPAILVVNDDRQVLDLIRAILSDSGFTVRTAANVADAMKDLSGNGVPGLIITDIYMPDIDGWSFCRLLRMPEYREFNDVPVLVMSATFMTDEIRRISLENGAADHLALPFSAAELVDRVNGLIAGRKGPAPVDVIIVEPDAGRRDILASAFAARDLKVTGRETLNVDECAHGDAPSVILYNPVIDGTASLAKIRRIRAARPDAVLLVVTVKGFMVPSASFLYAGAAAVHGADTDPGRLANAALSAARQSAFLQAGALLKEKINRLKEGEERYRFLVENIAGAIVRLDARRRILYASPVIERLTGYSPGELLGRTIRSFAPPEDIPGIADSYEKAIAGESAPFEFRIVDKNGGVHHVRASLRPIFADGALTGSTVLLGDITAEKEARESLLWERHMLTTLMDTIPDYIYFKDRDGRFLKVNRAKAARHGFTDPAEMFGSSDFDYFSEEHSAKARADELRIMKTLTPVVDAQEKLTWSDGRVSWASTTKLPLYDLEGKVMGTFGVSRSITERKRAEEEIIAARKKLADIINAMPNPVFFKNAEGRYEECNQAFLEFTGRTKESVLGLTVSQVFPDLPNGDYTRNDLEVIQSKTCGIFESLIPHADGSTRAVLFNLSPLLDDDGGVRGLIGVMQDITDRKKSEEALRHNEEKLSSIINSIRDAVWSLSWPDLRVLFVSPSVESVCGRPPQDFMDNPGLWREITHPEDRPAIQSVMDRLIKEGSAEREYRALMPDGTIRWVYDKSRLIYDDGGTAIRIDGLASDIDERKRAEEEIRSLLEEKELLLREVHHRIKNNMMTISSLLGLEARRLEGDRAAGALADAQGRVRGMMMIYDRLYRSKDFRRVSAADYLGELIHDVYAVSTKSSRVRVEEHIEQTDMDSKVLFPLGIIVNELLANALKYAFPDGREGTIRVALRRLEGETMELVFSDDGVGMNKTGPPGGPVGFGLNLVDLLTKQIRGTLEKSVNEGTRFRIVFKL